MDKSDLNATNSVRLDVDGGRLEDLSLQTKAYSKVKTSRKVPCQTIFIGSYASQKQPGIYVAEFNPVSGKLALKNSFAGIENASFLIVHPNGRFLYAVSETGQKSHGEHGAVWALQINSDDCSVKKLNHQSTQGDYPCHLALDQNGRFLIASNYGTGNATIFPLLPDGRLGERIALLQHEGSGPNRARQEGPHAHSAIFSPDNRFIIVADLGIDRLVIYRFDAERGDVWKHDEGVANAGAGPRHLIFHPNEHFLYAANELDNTVTRFEYDSSQGALTPLDTQSTLTRFNSDSFVADIHLSPDGKQLYISNRGDNSLSVFDVAANGHLTLTATPYCGGSGPRNFALAKNGLFALVANQASNEISVLQLGDDRTRLSLSGQIECDRPSCIQFL